MTAAEEKTLADLRKAAKREHDAYADHENRYWRITRQILAIEKEIRHREARGNSK